MHYHMILSNTYKVSLKFIEIGVCVHVYAYHFVFGSLSVCVCVCFLNIKFWLVSKIHAAVDVEDLGML